jgi:hypothetical protein
MSKFKIVKSCIVTIETSRDTCCAAAWVARFARGVLRGILCRWGVIFTVGFIIKKIN